ncbi:hypothetical protein ACFQ9J_13750 [Streptomyces sp. NPDC056529]|uniref:hypothetical protein n=1 Tax=Streptomyces sp. NPDC056529 TaxID=3345855 RepID=UPI0036939BDB
MGFILEDLACANEECREIDCGDPACAEMIAQQSAEEEGHTSTPPPEILAEMHAEAEQAHWAEQDALRREFESNGA